MCVGVCVCHAYRLTSGPFSEPLPQGPRWQHRIRPRPIIRASKERFLHVSNHWMYLVSNNNNSYYSLSLSPSPLSRWSYGWNVPWIKSSASSSSSYWWQGPCWWLCSSLPWYVSIGSLHACCSSLEGWKNILSCTFVSGIITSNTLQSKTNIMMHW